MGFLDALDKHEAGNEAEIVKAVGESISTEKEKEYCVWVRPTEAGWEWLKEQEFRMLTDILLPTNVGRRRVRITDSKEAVMTLKRFAADGTNEEHSEIGMRTGLSFFDVSPNIHVFKRATIPAPQFQKEGGNCKWDIDMFCMYGGNPTEYFMRLSAFEEMIEEMATKGQLSQLVKVELEVERFFTDSIRDLIPFECSEIIPSRSKDEATQAMMSHHWDVETNWK
tara:strand:- start:36 stop:707 length:672 start_codon:yes stop_codon:yes gene_type:complete